MPFELSILGSSSALPTSERISTAQVLNVLGRFFLIDCAEGTQMQLRKFRIKFGKINHIFISHLHGDHFFGLIGLLSSFNLLDRKNELTIYGPSKLMEIIDFQLKCMDQELAFPIAFKNLNFRHEDVLYEDDKIIIKSFPVRHRISTCGFLFQEKLGLRKLKKDMILKWGIPISKMNDIKLGKDFITESGKNISNKLLTEDPLTPRSYAYVTDTKYTERIVPFIKNVDLLYHETTFMNSYAKIAKERYHSTTIQAANIANLANAKKLIIGHFSARYKDLSDLLKETRSVFENTELAEDGKVFRVEH